MNEQAKQSAQHGERLQKVLAQVGLGSRRTMEVWISAGRITVNGEVATLGMRVTEDDVVRADKRIVHFKTNSDSLPRVLLYHKQEGEIVSRDDPEKRVNVFDKLPKLQGMKWIAIGRLDYNTSGLLIFTTSGDLANRLMHPRFEVEREYAVRVQGRMTDEQMQQMVNDGITLEDGLVKFERLTDEGGEGYNHWYRLMLKEGRNRVVRRTFDALGLPISRLIRVRFGLVNLPPRLKRGELAELGTGEVNQVLDWVSMESKPVADKVTESTRSMTGKLNNRIVDADHKNKKSGTGMKAAPSGKGDARRSATQHKNKVRP
ncbi:pseudouridine synthase [Candidatus Nitrotoga sp. M5]|uniref:pseudouridine synthase n=1 Tax=Candidatus Nitrotoga sp. M5 TaxID=2890409 RepID=UPI001EF3B449|nr:pseudouridine synthase [Candidatus Nitrotoga sp. M5]CAH1386059.1 Ribosomal large subunit pseudouridine synthase B [Candidatus Nitrotoga sp. M5]